jgi:hypothetical protein
MEALASGARYVNVSSSVMGVASIVAMTPISQLTTSSQDKQVGVMMSLICKYCVHHAIQPKGVGFLIALGHP